MALKKANYLYIVNLLQSIWKYMCPRCRQDKMFETPFKVAKPLKMHKHCRVCGQDFEPETGFYWGAMYVSYIITAALFLPLMLFLLLGLKWSYLATMAVVIGGVALLYFKFLRLSRAIWLHLVVRHDPSIQQSAPDNVKK